MNFHPVYFSGELLEPIELGFVFALAVFRLPVMYQIFQVLEVDAQPPACFCGFIGSVGVLQSGIRVVQLGFRDVDLEGKDFFGIAHLNLQCNCGRS